ncbi:YjiG family protein [Pectinatus cerevisiiphilus]|uniref:Spore maturation protein SpmB n=1 Tax=Pectinatus cerevisiiphilus TaxID=86956 RepID=A0A4R3KEI9_9FIRM|nr:YjiG family protein [Pectinatus cerevisiiphilus]TCS81379.1 spore maturation protein SpmB [Pectinatus cerevisiiphilus]
MANGETAEVKSKNILDLFVEGARRGFTIGTTSLMPNVVMAFVIIRILDVTGLLKLIGNVFAPVMALWGLPGEAAMVIIASIMSMGGAVGMAVSLYNADSLTAAQVTMLIPAIYLMGNPVQNVGRCLGIAGVNSKHYFAIIGICVVNALLSIWAMRFILLFL